MGFGLLSAPSPALATQVIGEGTIHTNPTGEQGMRSSERELLIRIHIGDAEVEGPIDEFGFPHWTITEDLEGEELFRLESGDPNFDLVSQVLTNGSDDFVAISQSMRLFPSGQGGGSGSYDSEAKLFFGDPSGAAGIDFTGFTIHSVALRIDDLFLESPGRDPNGDGIWTQPQLTATFVITGDPVPEPSTGLLLAAGLLHIVGRSRRRARFAQRSTHLCALSE